MRAPRQALIATALSIIGATSQAAAPDSNVPDVVTRGSGLMLAPMSRPAQLYATNCQGCHGESGSSAAEIPMLAGRVGYFARLPQGRRYLVQVPNVALNANSDADIAAVLNWLLVTYSRAQLPAISSPTQRPKSESYAGRALTSRPAADASSTRWWPPARSRRRTRSLCRTSCCTHRVTRMSAVTRASIACVAAALPALLAPALAAPDPLAQGRDKFVQCAACHGADGRSTVIPQYPKIGGQSGPYLINALKAYRDWAAPGYLRGHHGGRGKAAER